MSHGAATRARADLVIAVRALRRQTALLQAVGVVLRAARATLSLLAHDDPEREALLCLYEEAKLTYYAQASNKSDEVPS